MWVGVMPAGGRVRKPRLARSLGALKAALAGLRPARAAPAAGKTPSCGLKKTGHQQLVHPTCRGYAAAGEQSERVMMST